MGTGKFISKFNWRLTLIHLPATLFLILGARKFAMLSDIDLANIFYEYGSSNNIMDYIKPIGDLTVGERVYLFVLSFFYGSVIAILVSFAISLFISIRNRISWMNSFLVLLLTLVILGFEILYFPFFKIISGTVGTAFHPLGMQYIIIINGSLMTLVGLFLFFNPWTKKIIRKQYDESHFAPKEKAELNYVGEKTDWTWD